MSELFCMESNLGLESSWSSREMDLKFRIQLHCSFYLYRIACTLFKGIKDFCVVFIKVSNIGYSDHVTWDALSRSDLSPGRITEKSLQRNCRFTHRNQTEVWLDIPVLLVIEITKQKTTSSLLSISTVPTLLTIRAHLPCPGKSSFENSYIHTSLYLI